LGVWQLANIFFCPIDDSSPLVLAVRETESQFRMTDAISWMDSTPFGCV
jgi:hypothetical protein